VPYVEDLSTYNSVAVPNWADFLFALMSKAFIESCEAVLSLIIICKK